MISFWKLKLQILREEHKPTWPSDVEAPNLNPLVKTLPRTQENITLRHICHGYGHRADQLNPWAFCINESYGSCADSCYKRLALGQQFLMQLP